MKPILAMNGSGMSSDLVAEMTVRDRSEHGWEVTADSDLAALAALAEQLGFESRSGRTVEEP